MYKCAIAVQYNKLLHISSEDGERKNLSEEHQRAPGLLKLHSVNLDYVLHII